MSASGTFARGAVLDGRFRIIRLAASGGMGEVYAAEQLSLGRTVALKVLREEARLAPGMTERFRREALLLSSVDHPGVVRVIDFGHSDVASFLVMDLVDGESLEQRLEERGPFAPPEGLSVLRQIAEGLAAIHERGIIHRDLKPDNVVLTPTLDGDRARLLDFGIARLVDPPANAAVTQAMGVVLGTPEYVSPEQAIGRAPDARADVYAFGVLAYRMLSTRLPHPGPSAREFLFQHVTRDPARLRDLAPVVPEDLSGLVMLCLAKDRGQRPVDGATLCRALRAVQGGGEVDHAAPRGSPTLRFATPSDPVPPQNAALLFAAMGGRPGQESAAEEIGRTLGTLATDHRGQVVDKKNASVIATFRSPTDAARCAMGLLEVLRTRVSLAQQVRIAVHAGEITVGPDTVSGDPVTLAAAMAGLVPPGELFLTETVRLSMNRLGVALEPRGWLPLAGGRAIALYRCSPAAPDALSGNAVKRGHAPVREPRIAAAATGSGGAEFWRRARVSSRTPDRLLAPALRPGL